MACAVNRQFRLSVDDIVNVITKMHFYKHNHYATGGHCGFLKVFKFYLISLIILTDDGERRFCLNKKQEHKPNLAF